MQVGKPGAVLGLAVGAPIGSPSFAPLILWGRVPGRSKGAWISGC